MSTESARNTEEWGTAGWYLAGRGLGKGRVIVLPMLLCDSLADGLLLPLSYGRLLDLLLRSLNMLSRAKPPAALTLLRGVFIPLISIGEAM